MGYLPRLAYAKKFDTLCFARAHPYLKKDFSTGMVAEPGGFNGGEWRDYVQGAAGRDLRYKDNSARVCRE